LCHNNGSLLAFDEVITGFRILKGSAKEYFGIEPDLATFAKSFAGGFPIAMLSGRNEIMKLVGDGIVYHGGSFNSNVASIAAASASLDVMINDNNFYEDLDNKGKKLMEGIEKLSHELDSNIHVQGLGSVFSISFTNKKNIKDWREHFNYCDENKYKIFCELMFNKGIRLSSNGRVHLSTAHTSEDIDLTLKAIKSTLLKLKER
jgi:glutamate-1-semialdehyde 2,1-aminomutase